MNLGAKAWMDWHQDLLNTTSKVPDLLSGESFVIFIKVGRIFVDGWSLID